MPRSRVLVVDDEQSIGDFLSEVVTHLGHSVDTAKDGVDAIKKIQDVICLVNSLILCQYAYQVYGVSLSTHLRWLNAITGWDMSMDEFMGTGERIFNLKRLINQRQGLTGKDDTLPPRLLQPLTDLSDAEQRVPDSLAEQLQEYYTLRGWNSEGIPTKQRLHQLSLP